MGVKIGYPDQWKDYTNFSIQAKEDGGSLLSNIDTIRMSKLKEEFAELKPLIRLTLECLRTLSMLLQPIKQ